MNSKYLVIDVETPNRHNDTICQIGMVYLDENYNIVKERPQLINPNSYFDAINTRIHGITFELVKNEPTFDIFWEEVKEDFYNNILVCHQKGTDLVVINKQLKKYGIEFCSNEIKYVDTLEICKCNCNFESNKLQKVCNELQLKVVEAHDAQNDAFMCSQLFKYFSLNNYDTTPRVYDGVLIENNSRNDNKRITINYSEETICLRELNEYLDMVIQDGIVTLEELHPLCDWLATNSHLEGQYPYDVIYEEVEKVLEDGLFDKEESIELCITIKELLNPMSSDKIFEDLDYKIDFNNKSFVITGEFNCGYSREQVTKQIESKGGIVKTGVSKKTDYLIVGSGGSEQWSQGNYGGKIKKAIENNIKIIKEETYLKNLEE